MIECCFKCGKPTGRAGIDEDSIYDEDGDGPYCEECYQEELYEIMKNYESDIRQEPKMANAIKKARGQNER